MPYLYIWCQRCLRAPFIELLSSLLAILHFIDYIELRKGDKIKRQSCNWKLQNKNKRIEFYRVFFINNLLKEYKIKHTYHHNAKSKLFMNLFVSQWRINFSQWWFRSYTIFNFYTTFYEHLFFSTDKYYYDFCTFIAECDNYFSLHFKIACYTYLPNLQTLVNVKLHNIKR